MSLYATPEAHAANPPESWQIVRVQEHHMTRPRWALILDPAHPYPETFATRRQAEQERESGWTRRMYDTETRWYAGESVPNWKPYAQVKAEQERNAARQAARRAEREGVSA